MMYLLLAIIFIIYEIYIIKRQTQATSELLEGISDDINEIRMKLGLGVEHRTEQQVKNDIEEVTKQRLVAGEGIEEIKDYLFPLGDSSIPARFVAGVIGSRKKGRKKYDEFIRGLIKDFDEAKICPQCKDIYYDYTVVAFPHTYCVKCKTGDNKSVELVTTFEYKKRLS